MDAPVQEQKQVQNPELDDIRKMLSSIVSRMGEIPQAPVLASDSVAETLRERPPLPMAAPRTQQASDRSFVSVTSNANVNRTVVAMEEPRLNRSARTSSMDSSCMDL